MRGAGLVSVLVPRAPGSCRVRRAPAARVRGTSNPSRWGTLHSVLPLHQSSPGAALRISSGFLLLALLSCSSNESLELDTDAGAGAGALDLATLGDSGLRRVYGSTGNGSLGLPVAGGLDVDGDGLGDVALGAMQASPGAVPGAGSIYLAWGDGTLSGAIDTAIPSERFVRFDGSQPYEYAGSELWIDDVDGDGNADLLIARQNHSLAPPADAERRAAGALSIVRGGRALREHAARLAPIALDQPPDDVAVLTLVGAAADGRLGIWVRSGDVTGDGIADVLVGADQEGAGATHAGAAWLIAGGPHLKTTGRVDLSAPDATPLAGSIARIVPPREPTPEHYHLGATCQLADLDGNGRAEVLVSAALNRAGAVLDADGGFDADGGGGPNGGRLYIAWDDNFPPLPWPSGFELTLGSGPGGFTALSGSEGNEAFGEELLGGVDWDADGSADLFVGDLVANLRGRPAAGAGYVIYSATRLRGVEARIGDLGALAAPIRTTVIYGDAVGDITADTAAQGDFSGDGIADLVVCSPHANPLRRHSAGMLHVLYGRAGGFPDVIDLRAPPAPEALDLLPVVGARGSFGIDRGDTLCYSAATGDLDADGRTDLIANEMVGNGVAADAINVGNLVVIGAPLAGPLPPGTAPASP
jgi:hypothetical protein